jgi:hypothetical protein
MEHSKIAEIQRAMMMAMHKLEAEYVNILVRCGCKEITLYRL